MHVRRGYVRPRELFLRDVVQLSVMDVGDAEDVACEGGGGVSRRCVSSTLSIRWSAVVFLVSSVMPVPEPVNSGLSAVLSAVKQRRSYLGTFPSRPITQHPRGPSSAWLPTRNETCRSLDPKGTVAHDAMPA